MDGEPSAGREESVLWTVELGGGSALDPEGMAKGRHTLEGPGTAAAADAEVVALSKTTNQEIHMAVIVGRKERNPLDISASVWSSPKSKGVGLERTIETSQSSLQKGSLRHREGDDWPQAPVPTLLFLHTLLPLSALTIHHIHNSIVAQV